MKFLSASKTLQHWAFDKEAIIVLRVTPVIALFTLLHFFTEVS